MFSHNKETPDDDYSIPSNQNMAKPDMDEMELRIRRELARWGLHEWDFYWDRGRRRLGACWYTKKKISLSRYLLQSGAEGRQELWNTFLHELAHALAYLNDKERGHGEHWRKWCHFLGIEPERCSVVSPMQESFYRYAMRRKDTGEIVARYFRKPHFKYPLRRLMIKGMPETRGKLELVSYGMTPDIGGAPDQDK